MEDRSKGRVILYILGGGYLLYLAYDLFTSESTEGNVTVSMIFSVFFFLIGIVILGFAIHTARKGTFQKKNSEDNIEHLESDSETKEKE